MIFARRVVFCAMRRTSPEPFAPRGPRRNRYRRVIVAALRPYVGIGWGNAFGKNGRWSILRFYPAFSISLFYRFGQLQRDDGPREELLLPVIPAQAGIHLHRDLPGPPAPDQVGGRLCAGVTEGPGVQSVEGITEPSGV
jgi:hypothetical protein